MDFKPRIIHAYPGGVPLPFYMTYPEYTGAADPEKLKKDMEYFQHTYPAAVRRYQRRVAEVMDKLDYEGSMIYDEYPDRCSLQRLASTIKDILKQEAAAQNQEEMSEESERWLENMLQVLVCNEICLRRNGSSKKSFWRY